MITYSNRDFCDFRRLIFSCSSKSRIMLPLFDLRLLASVGLVLIYTELVLGL